MNLTYQPHFGKTVIFCLPGSHYSGRFLVSFTKLILTCKQVGINPIISQDYSSMVNFARCKVAGASVLNGEHQVPFGGKLEYDYLMWIDSDIRFNVKDFFALLDMNRDISSGWYAQPGKATDGGLYTPVVEKMDNEYFKFHGSYQFLTSKDMDNLPGLTKVDYIGFGWVLIKKGVFESIPYPWFAPKLIDLGNGLKDMCSEDVSFCQDAKKAGFDIWLNPRVRVGHEKIQAI